MRNKGFFLFFVVMWNYVVVSTFPLGTTMRYYVTFTPLGFIVVLAWPIALDLLKRGDKISLRILFVLFVGVLINYVVRRDIDRVLEYLMFFGGILGFWTFAHYAPLLPRQLYRALLFLILPMSLIQGGWEFLLKGSHATGTFGCMLFITALFLYKEHTRKSDLLVLLFSSSIVLLSSSRSSLVALIAALIFFMLASKTINRRYGRKGLFLVSIAAIIALFLIPQFLNDVTLTGFWSKRLKLSEDHWDVTAGRAWLWNYHLSLFRKNFWTGSPASAVDFFAGDYIDGQRARAGSESFFTKVLARDGIWGGIFLFFFIWLIGYPIKMKNIRAYVVAITGTILTAGLSTLGSTYTLNAFLLYWFYFSLLTIQERGEDRISGHSDFISSAVS